MTPKEKAQEIFNKMYQVDDIMGNYPMCLDTSKKCALIAVDEILPISLWKSSQEVEFWKEVKSELNNL